MSQPLTAFHKALELFHKHAEKGYHKDTVIKSDEVPSGHDQSQTKYKQSAQSSNGRQDCFKLSKA